jgi:hypothetical protein
MISLRRQRTRMGQASVRAALGRAARPTLIVAASLVLAVGSKPSTYAGPGAPLRFASPEAAVAALVDATRAGNTAALLTILGPEARSLISSGDDVADRRGRERFVQAYDDAHRLVTIKQGTVVLTVGLDEWPLPIPLARDAGGWWFETARGKQEILDRRVGRNELNAIQVCLAYVDAQREYYVRDRGGSGLLEYAQHFTSRAGQRDGLYWETQPGEAPSPLGPLVARARGEGYPPRRAVGRPIPYWGYYYRILTAQGEHARGGAYDYVVRGHMVGGFALIAYPAQYGASGVMTFMVNHDGIVYQKNLGPDTAALARGIATFDPDDAWTRP